MVYKIAVCSGDGIGPECMDECLKILKAVVNPKNNFLSSAHKDIKFEFPEVLIGGAAYDKYQCHLRPEDLPILDDSHAILFGAVGGFTEEENTPKYCNAANNTILFFRKRYQLFANLRETLVYPELVNITPIKPEILLGTDILVVRENVSGIYFGEKSISEDGNSAIDKMEYRVDEIDKVIVLAFNIARTRQKKRVTLVDKANVLCCSKLWRSRFELLKTNYPDITTNFILVDNAMIQLIKNPTHFSVIVTSNLFGDIISDLCSVFGGSLGMSPSASIGETKQLFEPIGGSAPDIAGKDISNPIAQIYCGVLLLRHTCNLFDEAQLIEDAISKVIKKGIRTADIALPGEKIVGTKAMGDAILEEIETLNKERKESLIK